MFQRRSSQTSNSSPILLRSYARPRTSRVRRSRMEYLENRQVLTAFLSVSDTSPLEGASHLVYLDAFVSGTELSSPLRTQVLGPDGNGDGHSDLYVVSGATSEVLRFDGRSGSFMDTFVSSESGGLKDPVDLRFGPDGNLYVTSGGTPANPSNNSVLRYDGLTGSYLNAAASGLQGAISFDFGDDGDIYVANRDTNQVLRYDGITGSSLGTFIHDAAGPNGLLRQVRFGSDFTGDGIRDLYLLSNTGREILRYNGANGAFLDTFSQLSGYGSLMWSDFAPDGSMYVAARTQISGSLDISILKLDGDTGTLMSDLPLGQDGWSIMVDALGTVYASRNADGAVVDRYRPASNAAFTVTLSEASTSTVSVDFSTASGTAVSSSDFLPLSGTLTFHPGQTIQQIIVPTIDDTVQEGSETFYLNLTNAQGASLLDSQGQATILDNDFTKFYVVNDANQDRTYEYSEAGLNIENYSIAAGNTSPRGAASNLAGDRVWVVDANKKVYVYSSSGSVLGSWSLGSLSKTTNLQGIATNGTDIWIVDASADRVYRYAGAASRLAGSQNAASSFALSANNKNPTDLVTDGQSLWIVNDSTSDRVFKYSVAGTQLGNWSISTPGATSPTGITIDPANVSNIWIVDNGTDRIYQYNQATSAISGSRSADASFALHASNTNPQGLADPPPALKTLVPVEFQPSRFSTVGDGALYTVHDVRRLDFHLPISDHSHAHRRGNSRVNESTGKNEVEPQTKSRERTHSPRQIEPLMTSSFFETPFDELDGTDDELLDLITTTRQLETVR